MADGEPDRPAACPPPPPGKPRRLKGHEAALTCCIASRARPGVVVSSAEDGRICFFDLRCRDLLFSVEAGKGPVSSICYKGGNEDVVYAALGTEIVGFDVHMASSWKPLETYNYNKDEINQISFSSRSTFLAAADDSGDVKIIDTRQKCLYKTLRSVHTSICSSVQFLSWRTWGAISGGLDSKLAMWDFSKGRPYKVIDFGMTETGNSSNQCFNPAFVHSIAVPEEDMSIGLNKICAIARGDGIVEVIDIESELANTSSKARKGFNLKSCDKAKENLDQCQGKRLRLDYASGGHTAAVSCVTFSMFGERGKFVVSGANDALVKLWNWSQHLDAGQDDCSSDPLLMSINTKKKVNWICTTPTDSENLVVCDTSKVMKIYTVA
ncbi:hypothetical protein QJS10_CPA03g00300 [Acorus calamus]|uniref:Transducin/WD40 repeat-like superfamily protein n=1 Tax=Acorus calamus TaxID=4465 RepID=A0AAV9F404_ACOCL|nr:hypothetical protein QJS10_CPA03g00300 [Acorus calamus]